MDVCLVTAKERLVTENHTLVVCQGDVVRCFDGRGVADLHALLHDGSELLRGASVADKVVGRAAAALMIAGGVRALHTGVVSRLALDLFARSSVEVYYDVVVEHVINRAQTDWCPLERRCANARTVEECLERIDRFMEEQRKREF